MDFLSKALFGALFLCFISFQSHGQCFIELERVDDTTLRITGTGLSSSSALASSGSFFNFVVDTAFSTRPTNLTPTITPGHDLEVNGSTPSSTSSSSIGPGFFSLGFSSSFPPTPTFTANAGSVELTWADGVLSDDVSCVPIMFQSLGAIVCNPNVGPIEVTNVSAMCNVDGTYTAGQISVTFHQQVSQMGINLELLQGSDVVAVATPGDLFTQQAVFSNVTLNSAVGTLTARFVGWDNCSNTISLANVVPSDCPPPVVDPPVDPIPTMSQWALVILALLMASIGLVFMKNRNSSWA